MISQKTVATSKRRTKCRGPPAVPLTIVPMSESSRTSTSSAAIPAIPKTRPRAPSFFSPHAASKVRCMAPVSASAVTTPTRIEKTNEAQP